MNGINRRGQKIVCVIQIELELRTGEVYCGPVPEVDVVYTVKDFLSSAAEDPEMDPGVELVEFPCLKGRLTRDGAWEKIGWPLRAFRPVDERETDISDLVRLGQDDLIPA